MTAKRMLIPIDGAELHQDSLKKGLDELHFQIRTLRIKLSCICHERACQILALRFVPDAQFTCRPNQRHVMQSVTGQFSSCLFQPDGTFGMGPVWTESDVLLKQTGLEIIQLRPDLSF